jgi:hypothetical protein
VPVIRIDADVWEWLKANAQPFSTPNKTLRRIAGLDEGDEGEKTVIGAQTNGGGGRKKTNSGRRLNKEWGIGAEQARFHKDGTWYMGLTAFPGVLIDPDGYILYPTEEAYFAAPGLNRGERLNVPGGISSLPGYIPKPAA